MAYDFINVMVYDKTGIWRPDNIGPHSPYSYAMDAVKYWNEVRKIPMDKIILGLPFMVLTLHHLQDILITRKLSKTM